MMHLGVGAEVRSLLRIVSIGCQRVVVDYNFGIWRKLIRRVKICIAINHYVFDIADLFSINILGSNDSAASN